MCTAAGTAATVPPCYGTHFVTAAQPARPRGLVLAFVRGFCCVLKAGSFCNVTHETQPVQAVIITALIRVHVLSPLPCQL